MMKTKNRISKITMKMFVLAILAFAFASGGCDSEESESHNLTVRWNISGIPQCQTVLPADQYAQTDLLFETIEINVYEDDTQTVAVQPPIRVACSALEATITRLPRDTFYITVDAYANYQNQVIPFFQGATSVSVPVANNVVDIPLLVGKGKIVVDWTFSKTCGVTQAGEIANVAISLDGQPPTTVICGDGQIVLENIATNQPHSISAQALDAAGIAKYTAEYPTADMGVTSFSVLPGQIYNATVSFQ